MNNLHGSSQEKIKVNLTKELTKPEENNLEKENQPL